MNAEDWNDVNADHDKALGIAVYDAVDSEGDDSTILQRLLAAGASPMTFVVPSSGNTCLHAVVTESEHKLKKAKAILKYVRDMKDKGRARAFLVAKNTARTPMESETRARSLNFTEGAFEIAGLIRDEVLLGEAVMLRCCVCTTWQSAHVILRVFKSLD